MNIITKIIDELISFSKEETDPKVLEELSKEISRLEKRRDELFKLKNNEVENDVQKQRTYNQTHNKI